MLDLIFQLWAAISTQANLLSRKWLPVSVLLDPERGPFAGCGVKIKDLPESFESYDLTVCKCWHSLTPFASHRK